MWIGKNQPVRVTPDLGLLGVAALWGLTFPLIRQAVQEIDPVCFVAYRFLLATVAFLPVILFNRALCREIRRAWPVGLALGIVASVIYVAQTIGLRTVPSPRAAFITGSYVLIVPLLSPLFKSGRPSRCEWISALFAILGLFLLINPGTEGAGYGDVLILCCALFVALHIHLIQKVGKAAYDPVALAFLQICGVAIASMAMMPLAPVHSLSWGTGAWISLLLCALLVTNGTFWLQAKFQNQTTPQRTAVIFALEPLFATFFGYLILGEGLSFRAMLGGSVLMGSLFVPQWIRSKRVTAPRLQLVIVRKNVEAGVNEKGRKVECS